MSQLTLRLPESLHQQLAELAENEGVSLTQYIIYALTQQAALAYQIQVLPEIEIEHQKQSFQLLIKKLTEASTFEIESVLAAREPIDAEAELNLDAIAFLQERIQKRA
jgi:HicB family